MRTIFVTLILIFMVPFQAGVAAEANQDEIVTIPAAQTSLMPVTNQLYRLATPDIFPRNLAGNGPASAETDRAWRMAIEFVFRTKLRTLFNEMPDWASPSIVEFSSPDRKRKLTIGIDLSNRTLVINNLSPQPTPASDSSTRAHAALGTSEK